MNIELNDSLINRYQGVIRQYGLNSLHIANYINWCSDFGNKTNMMRIPSPDDLLAIVHEYSDFIQMGNGLEAVLAYITWSHQQKKVPRPEDFSRSYLGWFPGAGYTFL